MYCIKCGTFIKKEHSYCTNCGAKAVEIKPVQKEILIEEIVEKPYEKKVSDTVSYLIVTLTIIFSIVLIIITSSI